MHVEVETPEEALVILWAISHPGGHGAGHGRAVRQPDYPRWDVPLAEMFDTPPRCARCRKGARPITMGVPPFFAEAPRNVADEIIARRAK